ncbi:MAG: (Fe-S)-binding protein, partial [Vicinamibacteria bacterium]
HFPYVHEGGFARAVELCNGAGVCRKNLEGTMCPSFMVTHEEEHSTRGRANALRAVLDGRVPPEEMASERLYQVMDLCISCKGCKAECPSNVDMARLKSEFLSLYHRKNPYSLRDRLLGHPRRAARLGVALSPLSNWLLRQGWFRKLLQSTAGIDARRTLPAFAEETFESWFRSRRPPKGSTQKGKVALFPDTFMNYHEPEIGKAATVFLEAAGFEVVLPGTTCCGRPAISKGMLDEAKKLATATVETLHPFVREGIPIVGFEPSCVLGFRDEYPDLVPGEKSRELARGSFLFEELLSRDGGIGLDIRKPAERLLVHGHCHLKALVGTDPLVSFLKKLSAGPVSLVDSGCCGMAGSFGYEREHYDISLQMAERRLLPAVREAPETTTLVAPGTSCRHQIRDATGRRAFHPAEVAARAAGLDY